MSPSSSISTNPAIAVPRIAPTVFAAYSRWNAPAIPTEPRARKRVSVGSVAPISSVAGARARIASANRTSARASGASDRAGYRPWYADPISRNVTGVSSTTATTTSSRNPYSRSGRFTRSANRPPIAPPIASPPKNPVRIVETACDVLPNTRTSCRAQTTS